MTQPEGYLFSLSDFLPTDSGQLEGVGKIVTNKCSQLERMIEITREFDPTSALKFGTQFLALENISQEVARRKLGKERPSNYQHDLQATLAASSRGYHIPMIRTLWEAADVELELGYEDSDYGDLIQEWNQAGLSYQLKTMADTIPLRTYPGHEGESEFSRLATLPESKRELLNMLDGVTSIQEALDMKIIDGYSFNPEDATSLGSRLIECGLEMRMVHARLAGEYGKDLLSEEEIRATELCIEQARHGDNRDLKRRIFERVDDLRSTLRGEIHQEEYEYMRSLADHYEILNFAIPPMVRKSG